MNSIQEFLNLTLNNFTFTFLCNTSILITNNSLIAGSNIGVFSNIIYLD